ncbi:MAG: hypothetical protein QXQ87_04635 [Halobacteria archaeon]
MELWKLKCPRDECTTFVRTSSVKVEMHDNGEGVTDEYVTDENFAYFCDECGHEMTDMELERDGVGTGDGAETPRAQGYADGLASGGKP